MRLTNLTAALLIGLAGTLAAGCAAEAQIGAKVETPPPPAPPPPDADGDGIPEPPDKCPTEKEDGNPPDPKDGCPNKDLDGDGILIPADKCPNEPETVNGFEDEDGCPDTKPIATVTEDRVEITQKILFAKASAEINEESLVVVDAVAKVLKDNPEVQLVEVGGHASAEGNEIFNRTLTQKRVDSVVKALVERGVEEKRLIAQGYGFYCLLAEGETEEEHEKNRRVEFKILHRKGKALDITRGCDTAKNKGVIPVKLPEPEPWKDESGATQATKTDPAAGTADTKKTPAKAVPKKQFKKTK